MSRNRALGSYSNDQYVALVRRALSDEGGFLVPATDTQAASLKSELYAWMRACEGQVEAAQGMGIPVTDLRRVAFRVVKGQGMHALPRVALQGPRLIAEALGDVPTLQTEAQQALDRLRALVPRETNEEGS